MKTFQDLKNLLPTLIEQFSKGDHQIGESWAVENSYFYEKDGWYIEINYVCGGERDDDLEDYWTSPSYDFQASGVVTDLIVSHYDEEKDEETNFTDEELAEIYDVFDEILEDIA